MDYSLQNLRTGESYPIEPGRTLIGAAAHASILLPEAPFLAALAVRYPAGWVVHGLSEDSAVTFNRQPLRAGERAVPQPFDVLGVGDELFRFVGSGPPDDPPPAAPTPRCLAYVTDPEGVEECRAVDHDLLLGRAKVCHVWFPDTRLSRLAALLAAHGGRWFAHSLSKGPIGRNGRAVYGFVPVEDGDELLVGPLKVRLEILPAEAATPPSARPEEPAHHEPAAQTADMSGTVETEVPAELRQEPARDYSALRSAATRLDNWLREQKIQGTSGSWFETQRERLSRFWYDTPEAVAARGHRSAGRLEQAFAILEKALRARPESPELLRELYRLYDAAGLNDLCYRPLRQIEKLAAARGRPDPWVLETLARVCERLGRQMPGMVDRAVNYWTKLESATGVSYARERHAAMAIKTLRDGGFSRAAGDIA